VYAVSGESTYAKKIMAEVIEEAEKNPQYLPDAMSRAMMSAVIAHFQTYRENADIVSELSSIAENLGDDEMVITRGC